MLRIGDFSKLSKVTIKALRYYEKEGLLIPKHVDDTNVTLCYYIDVVSSACLKFCVLCEDLVLSPVFSLFFHIFLVVQLLSHV